ncbi:AAA family ATPase [Companilactobacillus allii]|uniref:Guanylate kinase n=1 Tax=Companilactobacillus allii TaxID=1847728 RepID=A0A1P8Q1B1_9LACO|nr:AAA family ATPase [Companilactobacillus allii]APX71617.1 guanylate kinase [Companilactobacillus allii]USQ68699.1 AAA family ATPase [Companilactobacillus allii]
MGKKIIVITGASGTGKTTISQYLKEKYNIPIVITHTTRLPRVGEVDGVDYHFETDETFKKNHYLEQVEYSGYHYGSSQESLNAMWKNVDVASIVVDTAGAISYEKKYGDLAVIIFLKLDLDTVANRLRDRGDDPDRVQRRINSDEFKRDLVIPVELRNKSYEIVNKTIEKTEEKVDKIVKSIIIK